MAKIKNMGSATMKFGEGVIISGAIANSNPEHALYVSGAAFFSEDVQMGVNKRIYFDGTGPAIFNGPYIYGNTLSLFIDADNRMTLSMDKDLRILDADNNAIIHVTDKNATDNDAYKEFDDVNIFFSGSVNSIDGNVFGASAFGGDLVVSGVIQGKNSSLGMGTYDLHIGSNDSFLAFGKSFQFNADNKNIGNPGDDIFMFLSGTIGGRGIEGVNVLGGDTVISGSLRVSDAFTFPTTDGTANQVLETDGNGQLSWVNAGAGGVRTVSVDTDGDGIADQTLASGEDLVLKAGSNITLSESDGVVTINTINIKPLVRDVEYPNSNQDLATAGINADVYAVDCNGGDRTITLPAPGASHRGKQITFIKNAGVNTLTITAGTNNIFDQGVGTTNYNITGHLRNVTLVCLDYGWIVIAEA